MNITPLIERAKRSEDKSNNLRNGLTLILGALEEAVLIMQDSKVPSRTWARPESPLQGCYFNCTKSILI